VIPIADFDQPFVLETLQMTEDGSGGRIESWIPLTTVWAKVIPQSGNEAPVADALRSELTHQLILRYRGALKPTMRLTGTGRILEITAVFDGRRPMRWPVCHCREVPLQ
jgi:SPP1 family predicted phage head-tail adaptor